jgi:uncharacterized protein (DUF302 family)
MEMVKFLKISCLFAFAKDFFAFVSQSRQKTGTCPPALQLAFGRQHVQATGKDSAMNYVVTTPKTVDTAALDLEEAVQEKGFSLLHMYDLKKTLKDKGIDFVHDCRVLEICNPQQAADVLSNNMSANMVLPCRISVWEERGKTHIGMIPPQDMMASLSDVPALQNIAAQVEAQMQGIIQAAK